MPRRRRVCAARRSPRSDGPSRRWPLRPDDPRGFDQQGQALLRLGIRAGRSFIPSDPDVRRGISLGLGWGGSYGQTTLPSLVARIAARKDNIAKLAPVADAPRRHLYIALVSVSDDMAWPALDEVLSARDYRPDAVPLPELPEEITTAWIGVRGRGIYSTPDALKVFGGPAYPFQVHE
jgi:hypothetical protein